MMNTKTEEKKSWFNRVVIVQIFVCVIIAAVLIIGTKTGSDIIFYAGEYYAKLMSDDFTGEDFKEAFRTVTDYVSVFGNKDEGQSDDGTSAVSETSGVSVFSEMTEEDDETEMETFIGGGIDISFSELNALEGICFEEYELHIDIAEPLDNYKITSGFGYRISPITGEAGVHTGIDMAADYGTSIRAAADGTVLDSDYDESYGNYIKLDHGDNIVTIYAHCSSLCVDAGDEVSQGDIIAKVGSTGSSTGNHLHFEMRKDNIRINPAFALYGEDV